MSTSASDDVAEQTARRARKRDFIGALLLDALAWLGAFGHAVAKWNATACTGAQQEAAFGTQGFPRFETLERM
jgi:hypothetical protein